MSRLLPSVKTTIATLTLALVSSPLLTAGPAEAAGESITFDDPAATGPLTAGDVQLTGTVSAGVADSPAGPTSVLYLVDVSKSTLEPKGLDCDGDGAVTTGDDLNHDRSTGDTLDCEIRGVRALDAYLAGSAGPAGTQTGLAAFSTQAALADLNPAAGMTPFAPAGTKDANGRSHMDTVANGLARGRIKEYRQIDLGEGLSTNLDSAVRTALDALAGTPAGPRWIILLSDGRAPVNQSTLSALADSGVHLKSFAVGANSGCAAGGALERLASITGNGCAVVSSPSRLATELVASQPNTVSTVEVTVGGTTVAAELNAVGGWRTKLQFGAGTYSAVARAFLTSGKSVTTSRTFTVNAGAAGSPPAGSVAPSAGTALATRVSVQKPAPSRNKHPRVVRGSVRLAGAAPSGSFTLQGSKVVLQGRRSAASPWRSVGQSTVGSGDRFAIRWKPRARIDRLRVVLAARPGYAAAQHIVPRAPIYACKVRPSGSGHVVTCRTTAPNHSPATAKLMGRTVDRAVVVRKTVSVTLRGPVSRHVLVVKLAGSARARLPL